MFDMLKYFTFTCLSRFKTGEKSAMDKLELYNYFSIWNKMRGISHELGYSAIILSCE